MNLQMWKEQWDGLLSYLDETNSYYESLVETVPRMETIQALTQCLRSFALEQFDFLYKGVLQNQLTESDKFFFDYAFGVTLDQVGYDVSVIEQAANQRIRAHQLGEGNPIQRALGVADQLAYNALDQAQPVNGNGMLREHTTVLTYFQKSPTIRVIPYAPIVLVAIPQSCITNQRDFLAIPHEVGHYVYRHGRFKFGEGIDEFLKTLPQSLAAESVGRRWFEEIFADVYGTLVAGPVMGIDFQDLMLEYSVDKFNTDDDDHPVPNLRPHIYINVLAQDGIFSAWAEMLRENWMEYINRFSQKVEPKNREEISSKFKNEKDGRLTTIESVVSTEISQLEQAAYSTRSVDIAVNIIRDTLLKDIKGGSWTIDLAQPAADENAKSLYGKFDDYVGNLPSVQIPELTVNGQVLSVVQSPGKPFQLNRKPGETGLEKIDGTRKKRKELAREGKIPAEEWLRVIDGAGWATKGPDCEGTTGVC
ncbi:MAG: hypothetical protein R3359_11865 [Marinirhabdus sp.]|nr:hypothetical protein [Marinirhabdus sp.]